MHIHIEYALQKYRYHNCKEIIMLVSIITEVYADGLVWSVVRDLMEFDCFEDAAKFVSDGNTFDGICGYICYVEIIP